MFRLVISNFARKPSVTQRAAVVAANPPQGYSSVAAALKADAVLQQAAPAVSQGTTLLSSSQRATYSTSALQPSFSAPLKRLKPISLESILATSAHSAPCATPILSSVLKLKSTSSHIFHSLESRQRKSRIVAYNEQSEAICHIGQSSRCVPAEGTVCSFVEQDFPLKA
jgi:hypothetical protein